MPTTNDIPASERALAVETSQAIIAGKLSVVDGARRLADAPHVLAMAASDPELALLDSLASETAHLAAVERGGAIGDATIAEHEAERSRLERLVREDVVAACRSLLRRLGAA